MTAQRTRRVLSIVAAFAMVGAAFGVVASATSTSTTNRVSARFEAVTGLLPHSEVTFAGAKVGEVATIDPSDDGEGAIVTFAFERDIRLRKDASANIRLKSLLGEQYVAVDPGVSPQMLGADPIANTASDLSLDDLLHTMAALLGDITDSGQIARLVQDLTATFQDKGKDLQAILDDSKVMMSAMSDRAGVLARILQNLDTLTSGLDGKEAAIGSLLGSLSDTLKQLRGSLAKNVDTLHNTIESLRNSLEQVQVSKVDQALQEIPEWLQKFDYVFGELEGLVSGAKPLASFFVSLPPMNQQGLDEQIASIAKIPWLREYLIAAFKDILDLQKSRIQQGQQAPGVLSGN